MLFLTYLNTYGSDCVIGMPAVAQSVESLDESALTCLFDACVPSAWAFVHGCVVGPAGTLILAEHYLDAHRRRQFRIKGG